MSVLVIAEHNHNHLDPITYSAITAAKQLSSNCHVLVAGTDCMPVAEEASSIEGVAKVLVADNPHYQDQLAENISSLVNELSEPFGYILASTSTTSKNLVPRIAGLLDVGMVTDVIEIIDPKTVKRPIYAGNAIATVEMLDATKVLTVRPTSFERASNSEQASPIDALSNVIESELAKQISIASNDTDALDLRTADIVVSGGKGLASKDNFDALTGFANKIGAAVGASRAAVDAGFAPNDIQVGQTGKIVAPSLYMAVGISGAIQHLAGMKESKCIVAINQDQDAPIFQIADYWMVADWNDVLPELEQQLA